MDKHSGLGIEDFPEKKDIVSFVYINVIPKCVTEKRVYTDTSMYTESILYKPLLRTAHHHTRAFITMLAYLCDTMIC
jgi:hypothetical protein